MRLHECVPVMLAAVLTISACAPAEEQAEEQAEPAAEVAAAVDAAQAQEEASLYDRLGGIMNIAPVVDDFIERLLVDDDINVNPRVKASRERIPASYLKYHVTALVCQVTGGPCTYTGRSMKDAHVHLLITEAEWQAMVSDFLATMNEFGVPEREQQELVAIVESTKGDIVVPE